MKKTESKFSVKSSPLAPTSCKLSKQFIIMQNINAHYKKISTARASIDNKIPDSLKKHILVKERFSTGNRYPSDNIYKANAYITESSRTEVQEAPVKENIYDDLIEKHKLKFTEERPFTPRILKRKCASALSKNRKLYNPPKLSSRDSKSAGATRKPLEENRVMKPVKPKEYIEPTKNVKKEVTINNESIKVIYKFLEDVTAQISDQGISTMKCMRRVFEEHRAKNNYNMTKKQFTEADKMFFDDLEKNIELPSNQDNIELSNVRPNDCAVPDYLKTSIRSIESIEDSQFSKANGYAPINSKDQIDGDLTFELKSMTMTNTNDDGLYETGNNIDYRDNYVNVKDPFPSEDINRNSTSEKIGNKDSVSYEHGNRETFIFEKTIRDSNLFENVIRESNSMENLNKNVHFSNENKEYTLLDPDNHSLTDITSIRGDSDDLNSTLNLSTEFQDDKANNDMLQLYQNIQKQNDFY